MAPVLLGQMLSPLSTSVLPSKAKSSSASAGAQSMSPSPDTLMLAVTQEQMCAAQQKDPALSKCFVSAGSSEDAKEERVAYFVEDGLLMRKWCPSDVADLDWGAVYQIVVPSVYHQQVMCLAHDHHLSGHLGVTKTYNRILRHFFWPGLKKEVV